MTSKEWAFPWIAAMFLGRTKSRKIFYALFVKPSSSSHGSVKSVAIATIKFAWTSSQKRLASAPCSAKNPASSPSRRKWKSNWRTWSLFATTSSSDATQFFLTLKCRTMINTVISSLSNVKHFLIAKRNAFGKKSTSIRQPVRTFSCHVSTAELVFNA